MYAASSIYVMGLVIHNSNAEKIKFLGNRKVWKFAFQTGKQ